MDQLPNVEGLKQGQGIYCSPKPVLPGPVVKTSKISSPVPLTSPKVMDVLLSLKPPNDVVSANRHLLRCKTKAGHLAVKLAWESYFGIDKMRENTVSTLNKSKLLDMKDNPFTLYNSNDS